MEAYNYINVLNSELNKFKSNVGEVIDFDTNDITANNINIYNRLDTQTLYVDGHQIIGTSSSDSFFSNIGMDIYYIKGNITGNQIVANTIILDGIKLPEYLLNLDSNINDIDSNLDGKYDKIGGTISGNVLITGNTRINGNLMPNIIIFKDNSNPDIYYDPTAPQLGWVDITCGEPVSRGGVNSPKYSIWRGNFYAYEFEYSGSEEQLFFNVHIPHDYNPGSGVYFHTHVVTSTTAVAGNVSFGFEYTYANGASSLSENIFTTPAIVHATRTINNTPYTHYIIETPTTVLSGLMEVDGLIALRVFRDNTVLDNALCSVWILFVDTHINVSKIATKHRNKTTGSFYK